MSTYVNKLRNIFETGRNQENAVPMAKYMKNRFSFLGIKTPLRRELMRDFYKENGVPEIKDLKKIVLELWEIPEREYQYFAIGLLRKLNKKLPEDFIELYEHLVVTKSWWDSVDGIASWLVGKHFLKFPEKRDEYIDKWMRSGNMWLQRTCLLFQLNYKQETDVMLMGHLIVSLSASQEFFIRKAIGWILREYSKTDQQAVINFVENNTLSPLSKREAYKWMKNHGKI